MAMATSKRYLLAELDAANKQTAELSPAHQKTACERNVDEPLAWLKAFLEAQLLMQQQAQEQYKENRRKMQEIIDRFSQQQLSLSEDRETNNPLTQNTCKYQLFLL